MGTMVPPPMGLKLPWMGRWLESWATEPVITPFYSGEALICPDWSLHAGTDQAAAYGCEVHLLGLQYGLPECQRCKALRIAKTFDGFVPSGIPFNPYDGKIMHYCICQKVAPEGCPVHAKYGEFELRWDPRPQSVQDQATREGNDHFSIMRSITPQEMTAEKFINRDGVALRKLRERRRKGMQ